MADARRRFGYNVDYPHLPSQSGVDITLTINKNFQTIIEDEQQHHRTLIEINELLAKQEPEKGNHLKFKYQTPDAWTFPPTKKVRN